MVAVGVRVTGGMLTDDATLAKVATSACWVPELRALPPGRAGTVGRCEPGYVLVDSYDVLHQQVVSHHVRFGAGRAAELFRSPHRYVWPAELDLMGQLAGFALESRHADWTGSPFTAESPSHVSVYRLPPPAT